jgi:hypothetical protein
MGRVYNTNEEEEEHTWVVGRKARGKETTRKTRHIWVDSIKMNLADIGWRGVDWIGLAQDRNR